MRLVRVGVAVGFAAVLGWACSSFDAVDSPLSSDGGAGAEGGSSSGRIAQAQVNCPVSDAGDHVPCKPLETCCLVAAMTGSCFSGTADDCPRTAVAAQECDDKSDCESDLHCCFATAPGSQRYSQTCRRCDLEGEIAPCGSAADCFDTETCAAGGMCVKKDGG